MATAAKSSDFKSLVRDIPDFPKKGIVFKDITPLLADAKAFDAAIRALAAPYKGRGVAKVVGVESRGFLLAAPVALELGAGLVPVRKSGKLPHHKIQASYDLEYGKDTLEIHQDAVAKGEKVLVLDDVLATGGTAAAVCELVEKLEGRIEGLSFLIELKFLKGRAKLAGRPVTSLIEY